VYNVVLGLVDIMRGTNSYYKLQVLESDKSKKSVFFVYDSNTFISRNHSFLRNAKF